MTIVDLKKWAIDRIQELPTKLTEHWLVSSITFILLMAGAGLLQWTGFIQSDTAQLVTAEKFEDESWQDASTAISDFYRYWNLHRYTDSREQLSAQFAGAKENYSIEKMQEFAVKIQGGITVSALRPIDSESKENTKVFEYETEYVLKEDGGRHGERLRAYVVHRYGQWTIDTIQVQSFY